MIIKGDINGDGKIDFKDENLLKSFLLGIQTLSSEQLIAADINGDGDINGIDLAALKLHLLGINIINEVIE